MGRNFDDYLGFQQIPGTYTYTFLQQSVAQNKIEAGNFFEKKQKKTRQSSAGDYLPLFLPSIEIAFGSSC